MLRLPALRNWWNATEFKHRAAEMRLGAAQRIAAAILDAQDIVAELRQHPRAVGADDGGEIEDARHQTGLLAHQLFDRRRLELQPVAQGLAAAIPHARRFGHGHSRTLAEREWQTDHLLALGARLAQRMQHVLPFLRAFELVAAPHRRSVNAEGRQPALDLGRRELARPGFDGHIDRIMRGEPVGQRSRR